MASAPSYIPLEFSELDLPEMRARGTGFREAMSRRRSVRDFDSRSVPRDLLECAIATAGTAPSGAHMQPWTFVVVGDPATKARIREAAEQEEYDSYHGRMSDEWLEALAALGTDWRKPFLETAPWLVILFAQRYGVRPDGTKRKHYYVQESCGIAAGLFIAALHTMGLVTLTHTPSPMGFLRDILGRPQNEVPFVLFPVGYPAENARVPEIARKGLDQVAVWHDAEQER